MTPEDEEKIKFINEVKYVSRVIHEYLADMWNKIPSIFQSFFKIVILIFIMEIWLYDILNVNSPWKILIYPSLAVIIFLGLFYIYDEISKQWKKLYTIETNTDKLSELK